MTTVKVLEVTAKTPAHDASETDKFFTFKAYEFPNLVVAVPYEHTNDGFFINRAFIEGCGNDEIESVEETGETFDWAIADLKESIEASVNEFGEDDATRKAMELIATERKFVSNSESYEVFVGGITPKEFVQDYETVEDAVDDFLLNWQYDESVPTWLRSSLIQYVTGCNH
jgi:hypothetical protein